MKFKCLEKGIVYSEIEYDLPDEEISKDEELRRIVEKYKNNEWLDSIEEEYLYEKLNCFAKVTEPETIERPEEYEFEEFID